MPSFRSPVKAEVTSSNIVGYQKLDLAEGFKMYAPMFVAVGGGNISVQSVKPSGDDVGGWGDVQIQVVDGEGNISANYLWWTDENSGLGGDYWLDDDNEIATQVIADGDGVLVYSDAAVTLTCAGQVSLEPAPKALAAGFSGLGNSKLAAFDIQELIPAGEDVGGWGDVQIQIVDNEGNVSANYLWWTDENSGLGGDYWLDDDNEIATLNIAPGSAFLLYSDNPLSVEIPEPLVDSTDSQEP